MGPESYKHRLPTGEDDETQTSYGLGEYWYVDSDEVDNFCTMLDNGEIFGDLLETVCEDLDNKLNKIGMIPKEARTSQDINLIKTLQETIERLRPYRKKLAAKRNSGEIDLTEGPVN